MEIKRAAELLRGLADGRDPITGARLPDESVYNRPEIIRLFTALGYAGYTLEHGREVPLTEDSTKDIIFRHAH